MILIITPLKNEYKILCNAFSQKNITIKDKFIGKLKCSKMADLNTLIAVGGHGKTQFGIQSQYFIDHSEKCKLIICAGAAGSLNENLNIGDIVIGEKTIEHDYDIKFGAAPLPIFSGHKETIEKFKKLSGTYPFSTHYGIIASGDEDIISNKRAKEISSNTGALCVAWEGAGGAKAAKFNQIPYLEIRCVTDSADKSAPINFENNINIAISNFAKVYFDLAKHLA